MAEQESPQGELASAEHEVTVLCIDKLFERYDHLLHLMLLAAFIHVHYFLSTTVDLLILKSIVELHVVYSEEVGHDFRGMHIYSPYVMYCFC